jgi:hypothetical protein
MLKTSREQFDHLVQHSRLTRRTLREKKGKGIYMRVYHWMPAKSIKPLSKLAEIATLEGSITMKSHFFANCGHGGVIKVREIACFNCNECKEYRSVPFSRLCFNCVWLVQVCEVQQCSVLRSPPDEGNQVQVRGSRRYGGDSALLQASRTRGGAGSTSSSRDVGGIGVRIRERAIHCLDCVNC